MRGPLSRWLIFMSGLNRQVFAQLMKAARLGPDPRQQSTVLKNNLKSPNPRFNLVAAQKGRGGRGVCDGSILSEAAWRGRRDESRLTPRWLQRNSEEDYERNPGRKKVFSLKILRICFEIVLYSWFGDCSKHFYHLCFLTQSEHLNLQIGYNWSN